MSSTEFEVVSLANPTKEDFIFQWGGEKYVIKAGAVKQFPKFLADHAAKHLAKKMIISKGGFVDKVQDGQRLPSIVPLSEIESLTEKLLAGEEKQEIEEVEDEETEPTEYTEEELNTMNFMKLKKLAANYGEVTQTMKKPELIALILG